MSAPAVKGGIVALAAVAFLLFVGVAIHEWNYAADHPYRYGPAKVIATGALAGAVLSVAVGLAVLGIGKSRFNESDQGG